MDEASWHRRAWKWKTLKLKRRLKLKLTRNVVYCLMAFDTSHVVLYRHVICVVLRCVVCGAVLFSSLFLFCCCCCCCGWYLSVCLCTDCILVDMVLVSFLYMLSNHPRDMDQANNTHTHTHTWKRRCISTSRTGTTTEEQDKSKSKQTTWKLSFHNNETQQRARRWTYNLKIWWS